MWPTITASVPEAAATCSNAMQTCASPCHLVSCATYGRPALHAGALSRRAGTGRAALHVARECEELALCLHALRRLAVGPAGVQSEEPELAECVLCRGPSGLCCPL